ncbi:MAG: DUF4870 domain-containing protein [Zoogloeaceae bacterium]|jgi:uncharacterized Tic20 family protein|nr:DUF4870 domain-containing protein [Zoogloeaceae bacterium]
MSNEISADDKNLALLAHLLGIVLGFLGALVIWLINKDNPQKAFVNDQAKEALNFQLTLLIAYFVSGALIIVVIGIFLLPVLVIGNIVFCIIAGIAAGKGTEYRYPITLRLIK